MIVAGPGSAFASSTAALNVQLVNTTPLKRNSKPQIPSPGNESP